MAKFADPAQCENPPSKSRVWVAVRNFVQRNLGRQDGPPPIHPFDHGHRVDTSGLLYAGDLTSGHLHDKHSAGYYATAPSLFHGAIAVWKGTLAAGGHAFEDYSLLDIGCGKGRVLMMASEYPFREVLGVELNPNLAAVARTNLRAWTRSPRACGQIGIQSSDALQMPIPRGPVLLYLFNSFEQAMVRSLLDRLLEVAATRPDPIDLVYVHPEFGELVRQTERMELLADAAIPFSAEDAAADVFGVAYDSCDIFRLSGSLHG